MSGNQTERSPLARLVLFMVCLSIAAGIIAGISAYAAGQPQPAAPANVCGPQMMDECWVNGCDTCDRTSQECQACINECMITRFPDCFSGPTHD